MAEVVEVVVESHMVTEVFISSHRYHHSCGLSIHWCRPEKMSHDLCLAIVTSTGPRRGRRDRTLAGVRAAGTASLRGGGGTAFALVLLLPSPSFWLTAFWRDDMVLRSLPCVMFTKRLGYALCHRPGGGSAGAPTTCRDSVAHAGSFGQPSTFR